MVGKIEPKPFKARAIFVVCVFRENQKTSLVGAIMSNIREKSSHLFCMPYYAGLLGAGLIYLALPAEASAQDLTYKPINPTFGGNSFNSNHLLGLANAQNDFRDKRASAGTSQADAFARQLQSRLLSAVSSQIVDAIFGDNPQERGKISLGGQTIEFVRDLVNVTITITNDATGEITTLVVPLFVEIN